MDTTTSGRPQAPEPTLPSEASTAVLASFVAIVVAIALSGVFASLEVLAVGGEGPVPQATPAHTAGPFKIGDDVPTSFGFVAVEHAETHVGLSARQLGGATHGIGSFVGRDRALVQASVTLTNSRLSTLRYSPSQFRLVARRKGVTRRFPVRHASVRPGVLQPDAAIDARLSFVAPRDGSSFSLEFADPEHPAPMTIDLGRRVGRATAAARAGARGHTGHSR
jgi:hypothetical protein